MERAVKVFLLVILTFLLSFCGGTELSRAKAKRLLEKQGYMPAPVYIHTQLGKATFKYENNDAEKMAEADLILYKGLERLGYLKLLKTYWEKKHSFGDRYFIIEAQLTEKGRQEGRRNEKLFVLEKIIKAEIWDFKICDRVIEEIIGITNPSPDYAGRIVAYVRYRWKYSNFTPVYGIYKESLRVIGQTPEYDKDKSYIGEATFILYDDGWRVESNNLRVR